MTVLSKNSPLYLDEIRPRKYSMSIRREATGLFFSKDLADLLKMDKNKTILFLETDKTWLFACDTFDDGFPLKGNKDSSNSPFVVWDTALIRIFLRQTGHTPPCSFYVQDTGKLDEKSNVIAEILLDKTIEQLKMTTYAKRS